MTIDTQKLVQKIREKRFRVQQRNQALDVLVARVMSGVAEPEVLWEHVGLPKDRTPTADEFAQATITHIWAD